MKANCWTDVGESLSSLSFSGLQLIGEIRMVVNGLGRRTAVRTIYLRVFLILLFLAGCKANEKDRAEVNNLPAVSNTPEAVEQIDLSIETTSGECKKIAFVLERGAGADIYSVCPDGSSLTQLTNDPNYESYPAWSPDGSTLAFASSRDGGSHIYLMGETGTDVRKLTSDFSNSYPVWVPATDQIAFLSTDGKGYWWWRMLDLSNGEIIDFTEPSIDFFFQTPAWSPDGKLFAYMSLTNQAGHNDGSIQIHIRRADGSEDIAITNDTWANISPQLSPDGSKIAFLSERDGKQDAFALYVLKIDGTGLQQLSEPVFWERATFSWSPDGRRIVIAHNEWESKLAIIDVETGELSPLLNLQTGETAFYPSWQP